MRSVDLFCLRIRLTNSSLSEGEQKNKFYTGAPRETQPIVIKIDKIGMTPMTLESFEHSVNFLWE